MSVIDASVALFGVVFPHVSFKHRSELESIWGMFGKVLIQKCLHKNRHSVLCRLQMLDHFAECIKQAKGVRQQAVQLNIFTGVLSALKVRKSSFTLLSRPGSKY